MLINIKVKIKSSEQRIEKSGDGLIVYLKSEPENNKANIELIKLLRKYFGQDVNIIKGKTSRNKVVKVGD